MSADSHVDLMERLFVAFENKHTFKTIEEVTARCEQELSGQTPPSARLELLERLARHRLDDLPSSR